ncbi:MAG: hypothetical protein Q7K37_09580 [Dehalococcoidia bacterium]|nr:hypothetical protein [Dehalococcoidia bacterium]
MRTGTRVVSWCVIAGLGLAIVGCGGGGGSTAPAAGEQSEQSRRAVASTGINAGATAVPEGTDPLAAAVVNAVIAIAAKDRAALDALSSTALTDAEAEAAFACTARGTAAKVDSQQATVNGTSATVDVKLRMNVGMSIGRSNGAWEFAQQPDGAWKFVKAPVCVAG